MPNKEIALVQKKDVAKISNKELALIPDEDKKQIVTVPTKELATIKSKHVALAGLRMPQSCVSCNLSKLPKHLREYVEEKAKLCQPDSIYICDGTEQEHQAILKLLQDTGRLQKLDKMKNWSVMRIAIKLLSFCFMNSLFLAGWRWRIRAM